MCDDVNKVIFEYNDTRQKYNPNHKDAPFAPIKWESAKIFLKDADFEKSFFHLLEGTVWRWVVPLKNGGALQFPVNPSTSIDLLNEKGFIDNLNEFKRDLLNEKNSTLNKCSKLSTLIKSIIDNKI